MASFMSGMAGNVTAFNTVWTYDLYQTYLSPGRNDHHYLRVAKLATIAGTALSIGSAYILLAFDNLMDYMQPRPDHELAGLVFGQGSAPKVQVAWFRTPAFLAAIVAVCYLALNIIFR